MLEDYAQDLALEQTTFSAAESLPQGSHVMWQGELKETVASLGCPGGRKARAHSTVMRAVGPSVLHSVSVLGMGLPWSLQHY